MADESTSTNDKSGLTRQQFLGTAAVAGLALTGAGRALAARGSSSAGRTLRVGVPGGSAKEVIEGQGALFGKADTARIVTTFEGLSGFDENIRGTLALAEEMTLEKPDQWLFRVRDGVEFHNGKTLTADDVIYSLQRQVNPDLGLPGRALLGAVDPKQIKKLDSRTVRLNLSRPDVTLRDTLSQYFTNVVPDGYSPKGRGQGPLAWVGTGAYKVQSFTPGRQSVHVPFPNYWRNGKPHFDQVILLDFPDETARVNALLAGQIDVAADIPLAQVRLIQGRNDLKLYEAATGAWNPFDMRVDVAPFRDVRVRQAMRLLANRPQIVAQALGGHATIANDLYSPFDRGYIGHKLPQRQYDPDKARSLLKAAGHEGLKVDFVTSAVDSGMIEQAQVYAYNAKAGGVTVTIRNVDSGTLYGDNWLKWPFSSDLWSTRNYLAQVAYSSLPTSSENPCHWNNARFNKLYKEALATANPKLRNEMTAEMQRLEYDQGGAIIPVFKHFLDGYSSRIAGLKRDGGAVNFNKYGNGFRTIYFAD